jgi:hypothetical protein
MQTSISGVCFDELRAQYAELVRLREFVERLEKQQSANSDARPDDCQRPVGPHASRVVGVLG